MFQAVSQRSKKPPSPPARGSQRSENPCRPPVSCSSRSEVGRRLIRGGLIVGERCGGWPSWLSSYRLQVLTCCQLGSGVGGSGSFGAQWRESATIRREVGGLEF